MKHYQADIGKPPKIPSEDERARIAAREHEIKEAKRKAGEARK